MLLNGYSQDLFWLNTANILLGVVVALCFGVLGFALVREYQARAKKRAATHAELDRDMQVMMGDGHAFNVAGLGLTMADGGERIAKTSKTGKKAR